MKFPKQQKIRSKAIRQSAKGESCTLRTPDCNNNPETTVFCHAPSPLKGMGTKSDDFWGAYGCSDCHRFMDGHHHGDYYWLQGIFETQKRLIEKGIIEIK